ncbi:MAG: alpha/beta hydrolase [Betaproteobacteria bacterium]|nr:alpha/beta hydrolase [Betaproteobacteria bacterium]
MSKTVYLIHGMWGTGAYWSNYQRFLEAEGYRCIATTLPYHDQAPAAEPDANLGTASLLDYASALEREIERLDEKPILMGHSMGGLLAQMLGARGLARALVLLTPASPAGILALTPSVVRSFWSVQTRWRFWQRPMRQTFNEAVYSMLHRVPPAERRDIYARFVHESGRAACEIGYWFLDPHRASSVDESKITCPVLVVAAAEDRIVPASVVRQVAHKYRAVATYREFARHAHWVVGEPGWEEIAGYAARWLKQALGTHPKSGYPSVPHPASNRLSKGVTERRFTSPAARV